MQSIGALLEGTARNLYHALSDEERTGRDAGGD